MARQWTEQQLCAIEASGRDLLVSAGAGSGKTAVLTERIIRRLTNEEKPADISRMLIVTFTKAAAGELKERISRAIEEKLAENPKNRHLERQLLALDRAMICTIHSFCLELIREWSDELGMRADFSIADQAEITLLRKSIMNELIDDYFADAVEGFPIEDFGAFADTFVGAKSDEKLADAFLAIENKLSSFTEHIEYIKIFADEISRDAESGIDFGKTRCGAQIMELARGQITEKRDFFARIIDLISTDEKMSKAYTPSFSRDVEFMDALSEAQSFDEMQELFNGYAPIALGGIRKVEIPEEVEYAKSQRTQLSAKIKKLKAKFFSLTQDEIREESIDTAKMLYKLYNLLNAFLQRFNTEKRRRSLVDFGDLERLAYNLLVKDAQPTEAAGNVAQRFDEIYIDEYQDVNSIQDAIFRAVSNGHNRFMVGDIKQSIYAFRGAEPHIFSDYRKSFGSLEDDALPPHSPAAVFLSHNFRCDERVIDFANIVSGCLFTNGRGDIPFYPQDLLVHAKTGDESGEPVHLALISSDEIEDDEDISEREAEYVAGEISKLLKNGKKNDGSPILPSDIAVLMRSPKATSEAISLALMRRGIPFYNNTSESFFENAEVLLALCLLNIIDNPTRDIYLAGALRSPVFGFTLDELVKIRHNNKDCSLYEAVRDYTERCDFEKGKRFLLDLERWREKSLGLPVDRLLWYIYTDTDLPALVSGSGSTGKANLMLLYEYARRFESSSYKGLYNFIRYIRDILDEKTTLETAKDFSESSDTVKLMSIHQSKGLEFPVCFICGTGKNFNEQDLRKDIVIERSLGIALKLSDPTGFAKYDTPIRQAIIKRLFDSQLEEEMRILYVAMTRAREKLYVTALVNDPEALLEQTERDAKTLSKYTVLKNGGYIRWILLSLAHAKQKAVSEPCTIEVVTSKDSPEPVPTEAGQEEESAPIRCEGLQSVVAERFGFAYPNISKTRIPAKLSVSRLYPTVLDEDDSDFVQLQPHEEASSFSAKQPLFIESTSEKTKPATAAERGTATHLFMQFCELGRFKDCEKLSKSALLSLIKDEAARLAQSKFIPQSVASIINVEHLAKFFTSSTYLEICTSPRVYREHRFNVKLPAIDFTADEALRASLDGETVLVQGIIDCFFENPDGTLTVLDYKTDFIPKELTPDEACSLLRERHSLQLGYYKTACELIARRRVSRVELWSFSLGRTIPFNFD